MLRNYFFASRFYEARYFDALGGAAAPVVAAPPSVVPQQFPVPWYPLEIERLVHARPRELVAFVILAATPAIERSAVPVGVALRLRMRAIPRREAHGIARSLAAAVPLEARPVRESRQVEQLLRAKDEYIDDLETLLLLRA